MNYGHLAILNFSLNFVDSMVSSVLDMASNIEIFLLISMVLDACGYIRWLFFDMSFVAMLTSWIVVTLLGAMTFCWYYTNN